LMSTIKLYGADTLLTVSSDGVTRNCVQCHSPNAWHEAGTSDDRIPRGVHKGLSCAACHEPHSNYERNSCATCHPAISNCNLDVTQMNTTYADKNSPNNIHFVSCTDCH
ncbi:MAG: cytochrome c3 family protein, partial [Proteiniphilum sp.]|nr:cytochrome c3 family protein [Proteiniphilum sp.]